MTHDERISSFVDNELSSEQEQEFLISLAASDTLRRSFRSELVLKKVLHRDEAMITPPREMRAAIMATLGLGLAGAGASAIATRAEAAPVAQQAVSTASHGLLKTLFATKVNAIVTAATLSVTALAGYGVHSIVQPPQATEQVVKQQTTTPRTSEYPATLDIQNKPAETAATTRSATTSVDTKQSVTKPSISRHAGTSRTMTTTAPATQPSVNAPGTPAGAAGGGEAVINPPKHTK